MVEIYPFKAITPLNTLKYDIRDKFITHPNLKIDLNSGSYNTRLLYLNNLFQQNLLKQDSKKSFYCCRVTNDIFSVTGLVGLLNSNLIDKTIFRHEECIDDKVKSYTKSFQQYQTQIAPVILLHKDNIQIKKTLDNIVANDTPFFIASDEDYKYELWKIIDISFYQMLYKDVNSLLIADGHHRISSINMLGSNKFIMSFLMSEHSVESVNIYRKYLEVDNIIKRNLFAFLNNNFTLTELKEAFQDQYKSQDKLLFKIDEKMYLVEDSEEDSTKIFILEYLDKHINYKDSELNFFNYNYSKNREEFITNKVGISVLIPPIKVKNNIENISLHPPHSTLLYPKLPDGLISTNIE